MQRRASHHVLAAAVPLRSYPSDRGSTAMLATQLTSYVVSGIGVFYVSVIMKDGSKVWLNG